MRRVCVGGILAARVLTALVLTALALTAGAAAGQTPPAPRPKAAAVPIAPGTTEFTFPLFNDTYQENGAVMAPVAQGGMTVRLSSPENRLTLRTHRVTLTPLSDGTHRAEFVADFAGRGRVIADVSMGGGSPTRLQDEVVVPPQTRTVVGRVLLARGTGAYEITPVEMPERVAIAIETQLGGSFANLCDSFALLLQLDCSGVRGMLNNAQVPLPGPGETYLLLDERLTPDDRKKLDAYLAAFRENL